MDNRIVYLLRKSAYKNTNCEKDAEVVFNHSINFYNSLLLKGYSKLTAIKLALRKIKNNILEDDEPIKERIHFTTINNGLILIILTLFNCLMYFNNYLSFSNIIVINLIIINIITLYRSRSIFKYKNDNSIKELKDLLFTMSLNLIITILLIYDLNIVEFQSRVGYMLLIGNILYIVLFNRSRLILFISIPSALISVLLIETTISKVIFAESILLIYIAYLLYSAFTIKFIFLHNLLIGFFSIIWSLVMFIFNINYYSLIIFSVAFILLSIIIVKSIYPNLCYSDYKSIITLNILSIIGFLMISTVTGYINSSQVVGEIIIFDQKILIFVLFLVLLEVSNVIVFDKLKQKRTYKVYN
ncbi:MAG: hypothetical protein WC008_01685 [Bacilli bacterium]